MSFGLAGVEANGISARPAISAGGRYVAYISWATNLVPPNGTHVGTHIYVYDRITTVTSQADVDAFGMTGDNFADHPSISGDGRFVAFESSATNLVTTATIPGRDIFVHDMLTGANELVSVASSGAAATGTSSCPWISADGSRVAFTSVAANLTGTGPSVPRVVVRDRDALTTTPVDVLLGGGIPSAFSDPGTISGNGRYVTFASLANNLVPGDTNFVKDVFLVDQGVWTNLGSALPGAMGAPMLVGTGTLQPGSFNILSLTSAAPNAPAALVLSTTSMPVQFAGGTFKAFPPVSVVSLTTNALGAIPMGFIWPAGVAPGITAYVQYAILDPTGPQGWALSNALRATP
jgi:hypothetical protein